MTDPVRKTGELAMEVHEYFRLKEPTALEIIKSVKTSVSSWRKIADSYNISKTQQELKALAFSKRVSS